MANHYTENNRRHRMYLYVLAHPGCTSREVAEAIGMTFHEAGSELSQLRRNGKVDGKRTPGQRLSNWFPCDAERADPVEVPRQETVKTWTPCQARDFLVSASLWPAQVSA